MRRNNENNLLRLSGLICDNKKPRFAAMSMATVEEFQRNAATFLAAVEQGEQLIIARGDKPVARLLPIEESGPAESEHEAWGQAALRNLSRAYSPDEPDYSAAMIVEPNPSYRP